MLPPIDLLLEYDTLSGEGRARVDDHLALHPEDYAVVEVGRRLNDLKRAAAEGGIDTPLLAHFLVTARALGSERPSLKAALDQRLAALSREAPQLDEELARLSARINTLDAALPPAEAHFERLTGIALSPPAPTDASIHPRQDRPAARSSARKGAAPRRVRWVAAFSVFLVAGYGILLLLSATSVPAHERLAALSEAEAPLPIRMRGAPTSLEDRTAVFSEAVSTVHSARHTWLGLFPRYNEEELLRAEALLTQVIAPAPGDPLAAEAELLMGRLALYRGEVARARASFERVVAHRGTNASEAASLLRATEELSPP